MFDSLSIRLKIVLLSGLCLLGVVALIVGMNMYQTNQNDELVNASSSKMLTASVQDLLQAKAAEQAVRVQKTFGESLLVVTALGDQIKDMRTMAAKRSLDAGALREELNQSLKTAFERNGKVLGIWLAFEPNGLDGKDSEFANDAARQSNESGRFASYWSRAGGVGLNTIMVEDDMTKTTLSLSGTPYNSWYTCPRDNKRTCLLDPYSDTVGGKEVLMTTISVPLLVDGKAIGVVGVDIALDALQAAAVDSQRELFNGAGHMLIVSGSGVLAGYSVDASKVGKSIGDTLGADGKEALQLLSGGSPKILEQGDLIRSVYPVSPIPDSKAWGVVIDLPKQVLLADSVKLQAVLDDAQQTGTIKALLVAVAAGLVGLLLIWLTASGVTRPINSVAQMLKAIASGDGDLTQRLNYSKKDELGELVSWFNPWHRRPVFGNRPPNQRRHAGAVPRNRPGRHRVQRNERHRPRRRQQCVERRQRGQRRRPVGPRWHADHRAQHPGHQLAGRRSQQSRDRSRSPGGEQRTNRFGAGSDPQHRRTNQPAGAQRSD